MTTQVIEGEPVAKIRLYVLNHADALDAEQISIDGQMHKFVPLHYDRNSIYG